MVVGVPASRDRGQRFSAGRVEDAVHDLVVNAVAADRHDQRPTRRCGVAGQLTGMPGVLSRLQRDRHLGQPMTKLPPHRLGQRQRHTSVHRVVDQDNPVEQLRSARHPTSPFLNDCKTTSACAQGTDRSSTHRALVSGTYEPLKRCPVKGSGPRHLIHDRSHEQADQVRICGSRAAGRRTARGTAGRDGTRRRNPASGRSRDGSCRSAAAGWQRSAAGAWYGTPTATGRPAR